MEVDGAIQMKNIKEIPGVSWRLCVPGNEEAQQTCVLWDWIPQAAMAVFLRAGRSVWGLLSSWSRRPGLASTFTQHSGWKSLFFGNYIASLTGGGFDLPWRKPEGSQAPASLRQWRDSITEKRLRNPPKVSGY